MAIFDYIWRKYLHWRADRGRKNEKKLQRGQSVRGRLGVEGNRREDLDGNGRAWTAGGMVAVWWSWWWWLWLWHDGGGLMSEGTRRRGGGMEGGAIGAALVKD